MPSVYEYDQSELATILDGEPRYRVDQIFQGLWRDGLVLEDITTIPKTLRARLTTEFPSALTVLNDVESDNGATRKWVFGLHDGATIETVLMRYADRVTVCVSSQAGCLKAPPPTSCSDNLQHLHAPWWQSPACWSL